MARRIAILGAGLIGCMSALEVLRQGDEAVIVDPGEPGGEQAASYGNSAWISSHAMVPPATPGIWREIHKYLRDPLGPLSVRPSYFPKALPWLARYILAGWTPEKVEASARAMRPLLIDAPRLHAEVAAEIGRPELIDATSGLMHVYPSRKAFEAAGLGWRIRRDLGVTWEEYEGAALREKQPHLNPRYSFGVLVGESGHCLDPGAYVAALAGYARQRGAHVVRQAARDFRIADGRLKSVLIDGGEVKCDCAIIAAGAYSRSLAGAAGDTVPLETERGYHVMLDGVDVGPTVPLLPSDSKMGITMLQGGRLRAGGQVEIAGLDAAPNMARAEILKAHLLDTFPGLPRDLPAERVRFWMGHRPSMPDGLPCLGPSSASRDIIHAFGTGHVGLVASARMGCVAAQLAAGRSSEIPVSAFNPQRFRIL